MGNTATVDAAPQHLKALEYANRVRLARAELKRLVATGEMSAAEVIEACPWQAETMSVSDLLMSQRRWGQGPLQARARRAGRAGEQAARHPHGSPAARTGGGALRTARR